MKVPRNAKLLELRELVREFPYLPGIYLMKNKANKILYVGKAKNLRNRVRSYFADSLDHAKTLMMVSHVETVEYILTKTEVEAFLLEASMIKKHRPRYNIRLKDDKNYPYIKLTLQDKFPRLYLSRKVKQDGARYFGPYTSSHSVRETIRFLNRSFQIRDCTDHMLQTRKRPCMTYEIGRCTAPCVKYVSEAEYKAHLQGAVDFLKGGSDQIVVDLEAKMFFEAEKEHFESAARLRDAVKSLKWILERQTILNKGNLAFGDQDVLGFFSDERGTLIETLHLRKGRLIGQKSHFFPLFNAHAADEDAKDWLSSFLNQYYEDNFIPDEVILPLDLGREMNQLIEKVLEERGKPHARVHYGGGEEAQNLIEMACQKAQEAFASYVTKGENKLNALEMIQKKFSLPELPLRMECFDISNFQGKESVASQVVFEDGVPNKDQYRRYKIKTVEGANDFASMQEVLSRRFRHTEWEEPQLVVVDGGKGQLRMAVEILKEIGKEHVPVVGLAKARTQGEFSDQEVVASEERFYLPGRQNPVIFRNNTEAYRILVSMRDEAHRFAITFHRSLREKSSRASLLDEITGIGPKGKEALLKNYESFRQMADASLEELSSLGGVPLKSAELLKKRLSEQYWSEEE